MLSGSASGQSQAVSPAILCPDHTLNSLPTSGLEPGCHFVQIFRAIRKGLPAEDQDLLAPGRRR